MANVDLLCAGFLATADLSELFVSVGGGWTVNATAGARSEPAFYNFNTLSSLRRAPWNTPSGSRAIIGLRKKSSGLAGNRFLFAINDIGTAQCSLRENTDGSLGFYRGTSALLGTSGAGIINSGLHYYIEVDVTIATGTSGSAAVYVNGVEVLNIPSVNTAATGTSNWQTYDLVGASAFEDVMYSDIYVNDGSGGINDTVWGDTRVDAHFPNADGSVEEWSLSAGSDSYALVNQTTPDDDTTYIYSSTVGQRTVNSHANLIAAGGVIRSVALAWSMKKTDAGASTVKPVIRDVAGTTNYDGTAKAPSNGVYAYFGQAYDQDPAAGPGTWSESNFNAREYGVKKEA